MGRLYFATGAGLITYYEGQWEEFINENVQNPSSWQNSIKVDNSGKLWWGSSSDGLHSFTPADLTNTNDLSQVTDPKVSLYPNPAHHWATLKFSVLEGAEVSLAIYNKLGQRVSLLDLGFLHKGYHEQGLCLDNYPGGIYSIHLTIGKKQVATNLVID